MRALLVAANLILLFLIIQGSDPFFEGTDISQKVDDETSELKATTISPQSDVIDRASVIKSSQKLQVGAEESLDLEKSKILPHPSEKIMYSEETVASWSYNPGEKTGPENWHNLHRTFQECSDDSTSQSPLDLFTFRISSPMSPLVTPQYVQSPVEIRNTGNYLRLVPNKGSALYYGDKIFELVYIQVHTPSEHHMGGQAFPLELQFVHVSAEPKDPQVVILSVLYKIGVPNDFIGSIAKSSPSSKSETVTQSIDLTTALPRDITQYKSGTRVSFPHYTYEGSMTTPPCKQNVRWFVWSQPDFVSQKQVDTLRSLVPFASARPIQAVNTRTVEFKTLF